jgi:hypothetical protein
MIEMHKAFFLALAVHYMIELELADRIVVLVALFILMLLQISYNITVARR